MKVGFDISQLAHRGGVSIYTQKLTEQLSQKKDLEMVYFYSSLRRPYRGVLRNVKEFKLPPTCFEVLFNRFRIVPIESFIGGVDIFHSSDWAQPVTYAKKVTTYHDVIPLKYPQWSHPKIVEVHKRRLKLIESEIDMVIAVSETTKKDLLEISNIPAEKIVVIYEGVGEEFSPQPEGEVARFRKRYSLPNKFVLAVGGIGERRNLGRIKEVCQKNNYPLVISGETISWVADQDLPLLYSAAEVLLYPSFYEGFGLPILEAQSCGVPVITSNLSSMKEIAQDNALLVDPYDTNDIESNLKMLMADKEVRKKLIDLGIKHAATFTWEKCANETVQVYKRLVTK